MARVLSESTNAKLQEQLRRPTSPARASKSVHAPTNCAAVLCGSLIGTDPRPHYAGTARFLAGLGGLRDAGTAGTVVLADANGDFLSPGREYLAVPNGNVDGAALFWTDSGAAVGVEWVAALHKSDCLQATVIGAGSGGGPAVVRLTSTDGQTWTSTSNVTIGGVAYTAAFTRGTCDGPCLSLTRGGAGSGAGSGAALTHAGVRGAAACSWVNFGFSRRVLSPCDAPALGGPCANLVRVRVEWVPCYTQGLVAACCPYDVPRVLCLRFTDPVSLGLGALQQYGAGALASVVLEWDAAKSAWRGISSHVITTATTTARAVAFELKCGVLEEGLVWALEYGNGVSDGYPTLAEAVAAAWYSLDEAGYGGGDGYRQVISRTPLADVPCPAEGAPFALGLLWDWESYPNPHQNEPPEGAQIRVAEWTQAGCDLPPATRPGFTVAGYYCVQPACDPRPGFTVAGFYCVQPAVGDDGPGEETGGDDEPPVEEP